MTFTASSLLRFFQCGERYRLQDIEHIQMGFSTRQVTNQIVRDFVQADLQAKLSTKELLNAPEARQRIEAIAKVRMAGNVSFSAPESRQGQRRTFDRVLVDAMRLGLLYHIQVAPKIKPTHLQRGYQVEIAKHYVTGAIEIQEGPSAIHVTKVRTHRPEAGEAGFDMELMMQAMALYQMDNRMPFECVIDYVVGTEQMAIVRQSVIPSRESFLLLEERIRAAAKAVDHEVWIPSDQADWRCRQCPFRPMCRFV